ncbi:MAG: BACON domain-containing protein, partial [Prevotella sp.]|nr:BACON domain-containing protein [Prevotella sp.]
GPGYDTPEEAFAAVPFNMTVSLSAMNESLVTSYVYNGQYALGTSRDSYTLDSRQQADTLYLSTTYGSYSATASSNGDWLRFGSVPGSGNTSIPVTTVSNTPAMLIFNAESTTTAREGTITITSGLLKKEITVTQKSSVNGFSVTAQGSIGSPFSARITSSTAIRVTSTYNWRVRVDSDPDAIISSFTPVSGGAVTNQAITLTLKPNADWTAPTAEATLTFFSPAGEFQAVERKVSLAARTYETDPSTHLGWAGSNIYWVTTDASTGAGYLTFDDTPTDRPADDAPGSGSETYQGVFFKWGGLVGLDSSGGWGSGSKVYVPDFATGTWTQKTAGTAGSPSSPTAYFSAWSNIPYVTYYNSSVSSYITTTAHTPETWRGDICRYLSETGKAPGSPVVMWRMPTSGDFSGALNDYGGLQTWPGNLSSGANDGTWPVMYDGSFIGRRKKNNPRPDANGYKPFFSAGGFRWDNGSLDRVGNKGHYHSASRGANSSAYLVFYTDSAGPYTNGQAYGGIIRCVKAS